MPIRINQNRTTTFDRSVINNWGASESLKLFRMCISVFCRATRLVCENAINMVNETAPDGFSALHIAAANDNAEIASILLDQVNIIKCF